ncbi:WD40 repeat domain-containing protein [Streptomyces sp. NPDC093970]|uniref:WD40 repeat domain-containing protein n=1 Tax=Streptomyces sp. NPDC093970 TaxID=3155076 RepID=UPI003434618A
MVGGTPEAEELARYLRGLTSERTTRDLAARFGYGRTQWSEFLRGSKLIPSWLLRNVVMDLVDGPIRDAKLRQGCELLEAAEAAAAKASPTQRPAGSQAELELRLDDARKAQIEAQQTLMGTNQLVIMLLEMVSSLQRRCVRLEHERDQALAARGSSVPSIKEEIAETERRIVATEERLQRAREEREEAEDLRVTTHRVAEEHRMVLEEMQREAAQDSAVGRETLGGDDEAEEARPLWEYDRALEVADEQLTAHRRQMDRLWEEVGTGDSQRDGAQQVISGEVVRQDSADNAGRLPDRPSDVGLSPAASNPERGAGPPQQRAGQRTSAPFGKAVQLEPFPSEWDSLLCLALSPDGTLAAAGGTDGVVRLWNPATGERAGEFRTGHDENVYTVQFSPDGTLLAAGIADGLVRLWKVGAREPVEHPPFGHTGAVHAVAFSPDGTRLAVAGADLMVQLWNPATGQPAGELPTGHEKPVYTVAFSPDGAHLVTGSPGGGPRLWNAASCQPDDQPLTTPLETAVRAVSFSPHDGALLAAAGDDAVVRLWNMASRQPVAVLPAGCGSPLRAVAFSPDGILLASGGDDGVVRLWNPGTGQPAGELPTGCESPLHAIAFSFDGTLLLSADDDGVVHRWALRAG